MTKHPKYGNMSYSQAEIVVNAIVERVKGDFLARSLRDPYVNTESASYRLGVLEATLKSLLSSGSCVLVDNAIAKAFPKS